MDATREEKLLSLNEGILFGIRIDPKNNRSNLKQLHYLLDYCINRC